jgi:phosphoribosyl-ATP pyrophosphohydrolase
MLNNNTVSYIAKLLKAEERTIKKLTEEEGDVLQLIKHASKKRLNKKTLKKIDPRVSSLLMVFKEGEKKGLSDSDCMFLSESLHDYFFCLSQKDLTPNLNISKKKNNKKDEKSAAVCLIVTVLFSGALKKYCDKNDVEESFEQTIKAYDDHIKESLKNCKKDINIYNCKEVLEVIKDKYL